MEDGAHEGELHQMPMLDGFGGDLHESSMMRLLTSGMDEFPPLEPTKLKNKEMKKQPQHRECVKNHSASASGHAIDGCGEFMPGGEMEEETLDELKCAACGCHRNFHRRELGFGDLEGGGPAADLCKSSKPKLMTTSNGGTGMDAIRKHEIRLLEAKVHKLTKYLECLRNHQVRSGGYAVDGCQEFIARGEEGTLDALQCAACECHRSFHTREVEGEPSCDCHQYRNNNKETTWTSGALPQTYLSYGRTDSDDQDGGSSVSAGALKRRFRTKYSAEQVEKMRSFADKLGWKILKHEEGGVQAYCDGIGVSRQLFKVWMHNNKSKRARE